MGRWFSWRTVVIHFLLVSQLLILTTPALADDGGDKVRVVTEDPIFDGLLRKRIDAISNEEQEPEEIAFVVIGLVTFGFAVGTYRSVVSNAPFKALGERRKFINELFLKISEKERWEKHDHDIVDKYVAERSAVQALREQISRTKKQKDRNPLEKQLRERLEKLSKLAGNLEQSPSECVKLLAFVAKLDDVDNKLEEVLRDLETTARSLHSGRGAALKKAIEEWNQGKGLYAIEEWFKHPDSEAILRNEKMKALTSRYKEVQKEASDLVGKAIPFYNEVAEKRNLRVRQNHSWVRTRPVIRSLPLIGQKKQEELPLYDYRVSEAGHHDTKTFDQADSHHQPTGKTVSRADLSKAAKDQCGIGYEQMLGEVTSLKVKSSLPYTFSGQLTLGTLTGLGAYELYSINKDWHKEHGKNIWDTRAEGIQVGKRVDAVSNDIATQMTADDAKDGDHRLAPLYDGTTDSLIRHLPTISAQIEKNIKTLGSKEAAGKQKALDELKDLMTKKDTIRKNVALSTFQVVSEQRIGDVQRYMDIIRAKEEGDLVTTTSEQVNLVVDATLRKFFSSVSRDALQLMDNDGTIDQIRTEVLNHLRRANRGNAPDSALPISPLPGVKPEVANPKSSAQSDPAHVPTDLNAPVKDENKAVSTIGSPSSAALAIQTSLAVGEPMLATGTGPVLLDPMGSQ